MNNYRTKEISDEPLRNKTNYNKCKNCKYFSIPFNNLSVCNLQQQVIEDVDICEQWEGNKDE